MTWLFTFVLGWFGSVWWPGIEVDAPRPGVGDPGWLRLGYGAVGGLSAIAVGQLGGGNTDALAGALVGIAAGRVGSGIVGGIVGMIRGK